jgi:hypothetical protein
MPATLRAIPSFIVVLVLLFEPAVLTSQPAGVFAVADDGSRRPSWSSSRERKLD